MALNNSTVRQITGSVVETEELSGNTGDLCYIIPEDKDKEPVRAEIIGFREKKALLMPFGELTGIVPGCEVRVTGNVLQVEVGEQLTGRILNGLGEPLDGKGPINSGKFYPVYNDCPDSSVRLPVTKPLSTGCKVIDSFLTFGKGQRLGLFAGGGMGKSTTLGLIARENGADINVLILVGERGREVRELVEHVLKEKGMARSVIVVATSDRPAIERIKCCYTGMAIAEYFRDQGKDVMMMVDTLIRFAMAQREIGLARGEKPETKGYTSSVFTVLSKLLNRPVSTGTGTITSIYTVLVDGDDEEPVAVSVKSALDGHIKLKRKLAHKQIFPCIDIVASESRFFNELTTEEHKKAARAYIEAWSLYEDAEDLISIGAYKAGGEPKLDWAVKNFERMAEFRKQRLSEICPFDTTIKNLIELMSSGESPWYEEKTDK
ncbi:MAG: FliI/YscN family ATPase [Candidatus Eremiobacterota bacterium]